MSVGKTKTKVITPAITTDTNYPMSQSELEANTCNQRQARENAEIGSSYFLLVEKVVRDFFSQSQSKVK